MKNCFLSSLILFFVFTIHAFSQNTIHGLEFPSNGDSPSNAFVAFQFDDPQANGLPIWGTSDKGITLIWEYYPKQQTGYYVVFWWSNNGNFSWDNGSPNSYWGCLPYPTNSSSSGTSHYWCISGMEYGGDETVTRAGTEETVIKNNWYLQAFRIKVNGNNTKTGIFYYDLPDTSNRKVIVHKSPSTFGESNPPSPAFTFGDSPWYADYQHERMSGILGRIKIIDSLLTGADMLTEAADMTQLVTGVAQRKIWWGKNNFESVDDLTDDYGTGRSFHWAGPTKATRVEISPGIGTVATPMITPNGGTFSDSVSVSLTTTTAGADIYFTLDGSTPTTSSNLYNPPFILTSSAVVKAKAFEDWYTPSAVASASFVISFDTVATPMITPNGGTFSDSVSVSLTTTTSGADIYFTLDGSIPTTSSNLYNLPFTLTSSAEVKAKAFKDWYTPSAVASASFGLQAIPMCTPNVRDSVIVASGDPPAATIGLTGVTVDFSSNPGGQVNVNVFNCSPFGLNNNVVEKMWEIISTMSAGSFMLDLRIDYTDQEIAGLNEDSLTIAYLNPLDSVWWQLSSVEVFADGNYLIAHNLDHFTMFAIGESSSFNGPTIFTDLKVFLQGPYNDGSMSTTLLTNGYIPLTQPYNISPWYYSGNESVSAIPAGTVDWILVELRTGTTPSTTVTTRAGFLKSDGRVVDLDGNSPLRMPGEETGNYYVVIHHRNHLSVMSSSAVSLSNTGSTLYDFTTGSSQYYGTGGARDLGSRVWGMYGGEGNGSGIMTVADYNAALAERDVVGYNDRDYNLSGIVSINDANLSLVNRDVATQVP